MSESKSKVKMCINCAHYHSSPPPGTVFLFQIKSGYCWHPGICHWRERKNFKEETDRE